MTTLNIVTNKARVVAATKTLHHLLPDLVPPMDRAWTGTFFGWTTLDPQNDRERTFSETLRRFAHVAREVRRPGWWGTVGGPRERRSSTTQ